MKIVAIKFNHLGDSVVFVPALQALRQRFPEAQITLLTTPQEADLYRGPLGPQEIVVCPKRSFDKSYREPWKLVSWILRVRARHPDACLISFDQGTTAHVVAKFSGAKIRIGGNLVHIRVGGSLTEDIPVPDDARPVTWNWRLAQALARALGDDSTWPESPPPPDLGHLVPLGGRPVGARKRVVVHSGSSRYLNRWAPENFASVAMALSREFEVVWISHGGTTGDAPAGTVGTSVNSLRDFSEWVASADLFLGNNSGPMHLANALGCRGVAVTGPSAMGWDPYWHRERWTALRHPNLYCAPCEPPNIEIKGCANLDNPMACLKYWTVKKVEEACRAQLELSRSHAK